MNKKSIVIMCNGPSVRDINLQILEKVDTFGLNYAYKFYYKNDWWPTYHGSYDYLNNRVKASVYSRMTLEKNPIKRFFYISNISNSERFTQIKLNESQRGWNNSADSFNNFYAFGNSGTNACSTAVCMGYNNLILIGADCSQLELYDGVEHVGGLCKMSKTPEHNPNYWFDYYFEKGDVFNKPNKDKFHKPWWSIFAEKAIKNNIRVVNCSPTSTLTCFEKSNLEKELVEINAL
jgi:hypothetical protein